MCQIIQREMGASIYDPDDIFFLFIKGMRNNDFDDEIALFRNILRGRGTTFRAICVVVLMSGFGTFRLSIFFFLLAWC